jgi:hypothetical protein
MAIRQRAFACIALSPSCPAADAAAGRTKTVRRRLPLDKLTPPAPALLPANFFACEFLC